MKKLLSKYWLLIILILLSLTPVIWFLGREGVLINGLDTNFPLDPLVWFRRRLYVWNDVINGGSDYSHAPAGTFFHFVQLVPYLVTKNLFITQLFSIIFWFTLVVFSSYFAIKSFTRVKAAQLVFVLIYSFNIYLFNTWENIKVANLALVVGIPLFLGLLQRINTDSINNRWFVFYSLLFGVVISGSGINPAYFSVLLGSVIIYTLVLGLGSKSNFKKLVIYSIILMTITILINFYWILPLVRFLFVSQKITTIEQFGISNWLASLSVNTSLLNVLRLQGAWDWYTLDVAGFPLYIPYALNYFYNPIFIIFSFSLVALSLLSLIYRIAGRKREYALWSIFVIVGVFMGAGLHPPTGPIYNFFVNNLPFFSFFRSPWYIFTPYLVIGFAGLTAYLIEKLYLAALSKERIYVFSAKGIVNLAVAVFAIGWLLYSYPLVSGKIFRPDRRGFYIKFPEYVFETKKYLDDGNVKARILAFPDDGTENFEWGYGGTDSILGLLSDVEVFTPSFNNPNSSINEILREIYSHIKFGEYESAINISKRIGVSTLFIKNDILSGWLPLEIQQDQLDKSTIGEWDFYNFNEFNQKISIPRIIYIKENQNQLGFVLDVIPKDGIVTIVGDTEVSNISLDKFFVIDTKNVTVSGNPAGNSHKYEFEVPKEGNYSIVLERIDLFPGEIEVYTNNKLVSKANVKTSDSKYIVGGVYFYPGKNEIIIIFPEDNSLKLEPKVKGVDYSEHLREEDKPKGENTLLLYNPGFEEEVELEYLVKGFSNRLNYLLEYDLKYFSGAAPQVILSQYGPSSPYKIEIVNADIGRDWTHKSMLFDSVALESDLSVVIRLPLKDGVANSRSHIENLQIRRIYDNKVILVEEQNEKFELNAPEIKFEKISPVEYKVVVSDINDDYLLLFNEAYVLDWELRSDNDKLVSPPHFSANGYMNAWYMPGDESEQEFTLYYSPQGWYYIGALISIISLIVGFVYIVLSKIITKKNNGNKKQY